MDSAMASGRRRTVDEGTLNVTSVFQKTGDHAVIDHVADADEEVLVALGYKQEFKRDFSLLSTFSVSFSVLGLLPSIASTLSYNLAYSGPAGSVWGWVVAGVLIQFVALSMAEICSSMPTAGGLYYASAVLAPEGWGPLCSWITGWSNFLGQATGPCSVNYALSSMILTAAEIANPDYTAETFHVYLLLLALLIFEGLLTMNSTKFIGRLNVIGTITNMVALIIFVIWMPVGSINTPKTNSNDYVWTEVINGTEWPTGFAFMMGFLSVIWTMSGYDAPFHLSEECSNANIASPRAIVLTAQLGLYLGWAIILFFVGQGCTVASSRVVYAYSRDGALPGSRWLKKVNHTTHTPVYAVWFVLTLGALLGLLMFASPVAIGAVFSIGAIAQYVAFTIPIALKLFVVGDKFRPGPWHLGRFSKPVGVVACAYVVLMVPVLCFPSVKGADLNTLNMNYTCLIYGGVMSLALLWYAVDARKWFKGPKINVDHLIHTQVLDGQGLEVNQDDISFDKKE
ncbi:hypothetical protein MMC18_002550 [Xylographa bjoerkii]|nr:hypothetical protein [Xylographa bjoerkii]